MPPRRVSNLSSAFLVFSTLLSSLRCFLEAGSKASFPVSIESLDSMTTSLELAKFTSAIALFVFFCCEQLFCTDTLLHTSRL